MSQTSKLPELYVAVDVEADGPIPGPYSMLSLGMAVAGRDDLRFYTELKPISDEYVPAALAISGLDRERLIREAPAPEEAMRAAAGWVNSLRRIGRPVFLAAPAVWDGMFVHWYFMRFLGQSPFGQTGSGIDLRSYWMGRQGCEWVATRKGKIKHDLGLTGLPQRTMLARTRQSSLSCSMRYCAARGHRWDERARQRALRLGASHDAGQQAGGGLRAVGSCAAWRGALRAGRGLGAGGSRRGGRGSGARR